MKEITIKVYTINELKNINEKAYKKVIDDVREQLVDINFNYAVDDVKFTLKTVYGLLVNKDDIYYSISYCQGDGMCFTMDNLLSYTHLKNKENMNAFEKWITDNLSETDMMLLLDYLNSDYNLKIIKTSYRYDHVYTCKIDYEYFYSSDDEKYKDTMNNFIDDLCIKLFNDVYISICGEIEKMLYSYYDVNDEDVIDLINDNEYLYSSDGTLY